MEKSTYEFCNLSPCVQHDTLSDFLESCNITLKQFGLQTQSPVQCGPRIYGDLELIYVLSGEGIVTIDGTAYHGFGGDMFIIPKYSICSICSEPDNAFKNYWMHLEVRDIVAAEQLQHLLKGPLVHLGKDHQLLQCYRWLEQYYTKGGDGSYIGIRSVLHLIILRAIALSGVNDINIPYHRPENKNSSQFKLLQKCIRLVTDCRGSLSVNDLSKELYVSPTYIRRVFRDLLQQSPLNFIRSVRIHEAEILLLSTAQPISVIAEQLGFSSPYHFSGEFRKYHSLSPNQYRSIFHRSDESKGQNDTK